MASSQGEFTQSNEESMFIAFAIIIPILLFAGWFFIGKYVYAYERIGVYWLLSLGGLIPTDFPVLGWFTSQYLFFRYTDPSDIEYMAHAFNDSLMVNAVLLLPIAIIAMRSYLFIETNHPFAKYGRQMNLYDYMTDQFPLYPHLRTMWKLRLLGRPLDKGLFRTPESAKDFSINKGLVGLSHAKGEPVIDEVKAAIVFSKQLGRLIPTPTGQANEENPDIAMANAKQDAESLIAALDINEKAILAAIVPRLASCDEDATDDEYQKGIDKSTALVAQYWATYDHWKPQMPSDKDDLDAPLNPPPPPVDITSCDETLRKYLVKPIVRKSMLKHAYIRTFIYDAIQACRRVGKFPPCDIRWVMMVDREFWLLLSSAGRREPFFECSGMHAHYLYERKLGKACDRPQIGEAVIALVDELENRVTFSEKEKELMWKRQTKADISDARFLTDERSRKEAVKEREAKSKR